MPRRVAFFRLGLFKAADADSELIRGESEARVIAALPERAA